MTNAELIEQKRKQIEALRNEIREMKTDGLVSFKRAKISPKQTYAYRSGELWQLSFAVSIQGHHVQPVTQYRTLFAGTRAECIRAIPGIVAELNALYDVCTTNEEKGGSEK